jgi:hypothetical protein
MTKPVQTDDLAISHWQFSVSDDADLDPGIEWTDVHSAQGFARRETVIAFGSIVQSATARLQVFLGPFVPDPAYARVQRVPLRVGSGVVSVAGPWDGRGGTKVSVTPGTYCVVAAQRFVGDEEDEEEAVDLFLEPTTEWPGRSEIIVADAALDPPPVLVETADKP